MPREDFYKKIDGFVNNFLGEKPNYQRYNDMTGALVRCAKESIRRLGNSRELIEAVLVLAEIERSHDDEIAKYEDLKIKENSDVE